MIMKFCTHVVWGTEKDRLVFLMVIITVHTKTWSAARARTFTSLDLDSDLDLDFRFCQQNPLELALLAQTEN